MIDKSEIMEFSKEFKLRVNVIEKDYVLGWVLAGIFNHEVLRSDWVFKGGTCIKKCYYETYRFSEDLDFTLTKSAHQMSSLPDFELFWKEISQVMEWLHKGKSK